MTDEEVRLKCLELGLHHALHNSQGECVDFSAVRDRADAYYTEIRGHSLDVVVPWHVDDPFIDVDEPLGKQADIVTFYKDKD